MGFLDGIGLLVLILIVIACCSYCYRCCCIRNPADRNPRPRRTRRQKNARRKRRRRQHRTTGNSTNARHPDTQPTSPAQCTVQIWPSTDQQPQPVAIHPPYPPLPQFVPPFQVQTYSPQNPNLPADPALYDQVLPPPYESQMSPQGQSFAQPGYGFYPPPPPYDTQISPQPSQSNCQTEDTDKKY